MQDLPSLRVVPLVSIRRHEKVDPIRVDRLSRRIAIDGVQVNPMICTVAPGGDLVLLDGATRTEAMRGLGLGFAVIQLVEPDAATLETWHHVITGCPPQDVIGRIEIADTLALVEETAPPLVRTADGRRWTVMGKGTSANASLSALVDSYVGRWTVNRVTDTTTDVIGSRFPDWSVVVEFPTLSIEDVMAAAVGDDLLPAGMTRFVVSERALRLNADLSLLTSPGTEQDKQRVLDVLLEERARAGRVRRYEETVYILDD